MMHVGDNMSKSGNVQQVHRGFQYKLKGFCHLAPPNASWCPPDVLIMSSRCAHDIPMLYSWYPPRCTEHTLYRVVTG